jgi:hypothetical protein
MLTLEDPHRFRKSRDAACYVGLQPGRRNSGQSEPQMHISKEGEDTNVRTTGSPHDQSVDPQTLPSFLSHHSSQYQAPQNNTVSEWRTRYLHQSR